MEYLKRKRSSIVYLLAIVITVVMLMTAIAGPLTGGGMEYTLDADFDLGVLVGVEHDTEPDQLQLSEENVTLPFIWVPNMQGTVSKINTETGDELGRYWVVPPGLPVENGSPSRTTVDLEGNCWVGNRAAGTVVKIGLYEVGNWIDRNGDGICQTSQDTNGDGDITGDELLPWVEDECVLFEVSLIPGREGTYVPGTFVSGNTANATNPSPEDEAYYVSLYTKLSWSGGKDAESHDIYFGTSYPPTTLVSSQAETTYDPPGLLQSGTNYYWQIVEQPGDRAGPVWSFRTYAPPLGILREIWTGIGGASVSDLTSAHDYPDKPSWSDQLPAVDSPSLGDNYGGRITGVLSPETSGEYTFWIAADDGCELWLSLDGDPANLSRIAYHNGWTYVHEYDKYPTQESVPITLVAGQQYLLQALWKEGGGGDNCSVAWEGPDSPIRSVIDSSYFTYDPLEPYDPFPSYGSLDVPTDAILSWSPGDGNPSHDVYFGTSNPPSLIGNQTATTYDPGPLVLDTTYYWQIVEQPGGYAGPVWSFKTSRGTGTILREVWEGIVGVNILDLTSVPDYPDNPSWSDELPSFEAPTNWGDNHGTRIHGYLHPETDGYYTFWIASDDASELWLSTDDDPTNAVKIAWIDGWCQSRDWYNTTGTNELNQQSIPILLTGSNKYYIMALYKEGGGGDNLAVAWQGPDQPKAPESGTDNAIIAGYYLSPYAASGAPAPVVYDLSLYDTDKWSTSPRGLAVDAENNLWAGTYTSSNYHYIDGATGTILKTVDVSPWNHHAYGAVIDRNGILWSAGHTPANLLRMDPSTNPPAISTVPINHEHVYGLGLDYLDHLFVSAWEYYKLSRVDILTATVDWTQFPKYELYEARGVACTSDNNVWVATTGPGYVYRYDNLGNLLTIFGIYIGSPTGVAVDAQGKVWACNLNDEYIKRIDPATNTVDLEKQIVGSGGHYSYSDMTGIIARTITTRIGTWTVIYDAGEHTPWSTVVWTADEPTGTSITVKVRSSSDQVTWSDWETAENGVDLQETPCARYLQIETTLQIISGDDSPILYDLAVIPSYTYTSITYDGDTLVSTGGAATTTAALVATLRDEEGLVFDIDDIEVTFTLSAEGKDDIVVVAESVGGVATAETPPLEPDIYTIDVTAECVSDSAILTVYNPEGGFATGGGWIVPEDDELNTYPLERANFGFNAKYKQDVATGHLEFRYSDGYIDLKSSSIEQLVITGDKIAMFKGWASVNKEPDHWFFVKAIDEGEPGVNDHFDIKVWAPGLDEEVDDPTERAAGILQGGNIVVHNK